MNILSRQVKLNHNIDINVTLFINYVNISAEKNILGNIQ